MIPGADCLGFDKESHRAYFKIYIAFDYQQLPLFSNIIQSSILMQNT